QPIPLDFALAYLSGGPASLLPVELRTAVRPLFGFEVAGYEDYQFQRGDVQEGVERFENRFGAESGSSPRPSPPPARAFTLDAAGGLRTQIEPPPAADTPQQIVAEMAFRDPNGEIQTIARSIPVHPSERLIGLRVAPHRGADEPLRVDVALFDLEQKPVRGRVRVDLFERKVYSHRKRLVGGFYAYEHTAETVALGPLCEGRTDRHGRYDCSAPLSATGDLIVRATTTDDAGRLAATRDGLWVPGPDEAWSEAGDSERMDIVPEQRWVEPGGRARIHVRMPFRKATALVTVEREGVAEAFVKRLSGRDPRFDLKVLPAHAPNVFVSVLAVRGRVDAPAPTARVDLARPASRLGLTELRVGLAPRTLEVEVEPERARYAVRERVRARVRVRTAEGKRPPPGSEIALAVVDEALLELAPNESWNLLEAMHGRRSYDVETFTAMLEVVGRRHFGLKARPSGGGGGASATRELFDTLLAWQPRVALDAEGEALVEFTLGDALSSFRIAAIASGGIDRFGTGHGRLQTTQDLMILPGVAPVAREGDRIRPEFTVRNASERPLEVEASLRIEGLEGVEDAGGGFASIPLVLAPGAAQTVAWDVEVPVGRSSLAWEAAAIASTGESDRVRVPQRITPAVPERVVAAELVQLGAADAPLATVAPPADALAGRGGIDVRLRASLAQGTAGLERYLRTYPYGCLEQKTSVAIGLRDRARWDALIAELPGHLDEDGLARFWPTERLRGSDVLTAYLLAISDEAGWPIPEPTRARMLDGLEAFVAGRIIRPGWRVTADEPLRRIAALEALSRAGRVRPEQLASLPPNVELWPTSALIDALGLALRVAATPESAGLRRRVEQALATRLTVGGTTVGFSTDATDDLDGLLATPETNLHRLLLIAHGHPRFEPMLPRLMKGAIARQHEGRWQTTIANAWGRLALERHAERFEKEPVAGTTALSLGAASAVVAWQDGQPGEIVRLPFGDGETALRAEHHGSGRPWADVQAVAAIPLRSPLFAGYAIERSWTAVVQKTPGVYSRGDVVRVRLEVDAQSDFSWVVVDDPIPAGATILGSGLGRDSALLRTGEDAGGVMGGGTAFGWGHPYRAFSERTELAYREFFGFLPKGRVAIEYTLRLNQDGLFQLPPTRVEAMYAPESFGELPHDPLEIAP
ncbi:MAG: alpha-2-macroglobulin family protein, partial [Myxococcota bacterium]